MRKYLDMIDVNDINNSLRDLIRSEYYSYMFSDDKDTTLSGHVMEHFIQELSDETNLEISKIEQAIRMNYVAFSKDDFYLVCDYFGKMYVEVLPFPELSDQVISEEYALFFGKVLLDIEEMNSELQGIFFQECMKLLEE